MRKEVLVSLFVILCLVSIATASATTLGFNPGSVYEAQTHSFNLSVNNFGYPKMINDISLTLTDFSVVDVVDFLGWSNSYTNTTIRWFGGSIENNVLLALFQFMAAAPIVTENKSSVLAVNVKYTDGTNQVFNIPVTLLNDYTGPVLTNTVPADNGLLRANAPSQIVSADAVDEETGVKEIKFSWKECGNATASQSTLTCNGTLCAGTADFSAYSEGERACFEFIAKNNANEVTVVNGSVGFDGTAPAVTLISPADNAKIGRYWTFEFRAADNLASTLTCDFVLDNAVYSSVQVQNNLVSNITVDFISAPEGDHDWKVSCTDQVGLTGNSEVRDFELDKTPPAIKLNSPSNGSILPETATIDITVSDNTALADVQTNRDLDDLTTWPSGKNDVLITARDAAGNTASAIFTFFIDRTAPVLSNLAPGDNANIDQHVTFTFDINDDYDPRIDCKLVLDGHTDLSAAFDSGTQGSFVKTLSLGSHNWSIECTDDAGNKANSAQRNLVALDQSGPDIVLEDVVTVARGDSFAIDATVTDVSGVANVYAKLGTTTVGLNKNGDSYTQDVSTSSSSSLGNYTYTVYATDTLDYTSSESDIFLLVNGYIFTLNLNPSSVSPGGSVTLTGNVVSDDSTNIPENSLRLILPDGTTTLAINANGDFMHTFVAPDTAGVYDIVVEIVGNNGHTYSDYVQLTVQGVGGSSSDGSGTGRGFKPHTQQKPKEVYVENSDNENIIEESEDDEPGDDSDDGSEPLVVEQKPIEKEIPGIGKSTSFFSAPVFKWLGALILAMVVISLAVIAFSRMKKTGPGKRDEWDNYIERRREE